MKWIGQSGFCRCVLVQSTKLNIHDLFLIKLIATAKQMRLSILCLPACRRPGSGYHDPWRWGGVWRGCSAGGTRHPAFGCRGRCPACGQSSPPTAHHVHHPPAQLLPPQRVSLHTEIRLSTVPDLPYWKNQDCGSGQVRSIRFFRIRSLDPTYDKTEKAGKTKFCSMKLINLTKISKKIRFFCLIIQKFI